MSPYGICSQKKMNWDTFFALMFNRPNTFQKYHSCKIRVFRGIQKKEDSFLGVLVLIPAVPKTDQSCHYLLYVFRYTRWELFVDNFSF